MHYTNSVNKSTPCRQEKGFWLPYFCIYYLKSLKINSRYVKIQCRQAYFLKPGKNFDTIFSSNNNIQSRKVQIVQRFTYSSILGTDKQILCEAENACKNDLFLSKQENYNQIQLDQGIISKLPITGTGLYTGYFLCNVCNVTAQNYSCVKSWGFHREKI